MEQSDLKSKLLQASLMHVAFDGWTRATFDAAIADAGISTAEALAVCPRGAVDLAVAYHEAGDAMMLERLRDADLSALKFRERIIFAVRARIEAVDDKEAVRRGTTLFALPQHAADGARLIWGTCDQIWSALGDTSDDINWYSKRAILSGVYGATVLFWLGDESENNEATWAFLDRRIENVMQFEGLKAKIRSNAPLSRLIAGPMAILGRIKAPGARMSGFPGSVTRPDQGE